MESHMGFAPTQTRFADVGLTTWLVRHMGGWAGAAPASPGSQSGILLLN